MGHAIGPCGLIVEAFFVFKLKKLGGRDTQFLFDFNILEENGNWDFCEGKNPTKRNIHKRD